MTGCKASSMLSQRTFPQGEDGTDDFLFTEEKVLPVMVIIFKIRKHPSNALAVALSAKRNKIYRELIMGSVEIVNDIRLVCLSGNKMTEKERVEIVFGIRPKLKVMNKKLQRLTKAVKYTSMADIWAEIEEGSHDKADKKAIVKDCMNRWKRNGKIK